MATPRNSKRLLFVSIFALVFTVGGIGATAYSWLSTRATRWGDSLIVGPRFSGDFGSGARKIRVSWEEGAPVVDAPSWKGRGPITMTFIWGFTVYHLPPGTLSGSTSPR
ncbi:MAG: hypothetical protein K0Q72_4511 [Armatimonadetes bacterium]|jgi:hypothetical protein|nr:hypothetical protein [Armatimonadota bacterium]